MEDWKQLYEISKSLWDEAAWVISGLSAVGLIGYELGKRKPNKDIIEIPDKSPNAIEETEPSKSHVLRDVWLKPVSQERELQRPSGKTAIPIVSVLNMKGGVGKTTLTANLAASLISSGKRLLLIDFDYQGTLSIMFASVAQKAGLKESASKLLRDSDVESVFSKVEKLTIDGKHEVDLFPAHYSLFRDEMELFANWAAGDPMDIRYSLSKLVLEERVQENYDLVLIDCGPRFTTSTINALCASTHFIVPTILDELSTQAVAYLAKELEGHRKDLLEDLKLLGVVPTMVQQDPNLINGGPPKFLSREENQLREVTTRIKGWADGGEVLLKDARIPRRACFTKNAHSVAYWEDDDEKQEARKIFDRAAKIIWDKLNEDDRFST